MVKRTTSPAAKLASPQHQLAATVQGPRTTMTIISNQEEASVHLGAGDTTADQRVIARLLCFHDEDVDHSTRDCRTTKEAKDKMEAERVAWGHLDQLPKAITHTFQPQFHHPY
jgi:hypothetical protein